nr:hypothetical protein CFP56_63991 [Quercus suber]
MRTSHHHSSGLTPDHNDSPILLLPNEVLRYVLEFVEPDSDYAIPIDRRQFLSVESFDLPPLDHNFARNAGSLRCVCKRFADAGAPLLFTRAAARFSNAGLRRIERLSEWPHLACHVKKFSYMVPYFYRIQAQQVRNTSQDAQAARSRLDIQRLRQKIDEQNQITSSREDVRILTKVFASFSSLQLVQLLRVTDRDDDVLAAYIRRSEDSKEFDMDWARACSHSAQTIGEALLASNVPSLRFSFPMLSPQSVRLLQDARPDSLFKLASTLTCLTLHFDDDTANLNHKISDLSPLFRTVFTTAQSMQAVHVGFPSHRPISLPLESVFHDVAWERLVAFSIQGWKLEAAEIINLATRYKDRLKGLRLRDVHVKEGGMWRDVLHALRDRLQRLRWVSLRRIGYERHFETARLAIGPEISEDDWASDSSSEIDSSSDENEDGGEDAPGHDSADGNDWADEDSQSNSGSEDGPANNDMNFPLLDSPNAPISYVARYKFEAQTQPFSSPDLDDDGHFVSNTKRRAWEAWVVRKYPAYNEQ